MLNRILKALRRFLDSIRSLRGKFLITYCVVGFIPLAVFTFSSTQTISNYLINQKEIRLKRQANRLSTNIGKSGYFDDSVKLKFLEEEVDINSQTNGNRVLVLNEHAKVISDSSRAEINKSIIIPEVITALNKTDVSSVNREDASIYVAVSILDVDDNVAGAVLLIDTISEINDTVADIQKNMLLTMVPMAFIILLFVVLASFLLVEPLDKLLEAVSKMSEGHLNQEIEIKGNDEYAKLAEAFNEMSSRLSQVETARQEFVSNVSHELKTPLSSIKVLSESLLVQENVPEELYIEFLEDINSEIDRMNSIVEDLLTLVKIDQTETVLVTKPVVTSELVFDILNRLEPLAMQKDIELIVNKIKDSTIEVDEMKVSLAISNVIENGIKYTDPGGSVTITMDADHQNAFITVTDTGIGIEEEEIPHVFSRFYRVDKTRDRETGGTGLGLAITHKTILQHNGSIRLTSEVNKGSTFLIRLPLR